MAQVLGENFPPYVQNQIKIRQKKLSLQARQRFSNGGESVDDVLKFVTTKTSFIKLTSGIDVSGSSNLAKDNVLFGGDYPNKNDFASYTRSKQFGPTPPPGITLAEIRPLELGTIREANIQIVCHSLEQFKIIEKLYLRLKYSILLEWGHTVYFDNDGKLINNPAFKEDLSDYYLNNKNLNQYNILDKIENNRQASNGNYDAFIGLVTNFDWTLRLDGGYDINLRAYSLGDIIESLKLNTNFPQDPNNPINENVDPITLNKNKSTLNYILYCLKQEIDIQAGSNLTFALNGFNPGSEVSVSTGEIERITGLKKNFTNPNEKWDTANNILTYKEVTRGYFPYLGTQENPFQYFIKLGTLLRIIENFLLIYDLKNADKNPPIFRFDYDYEKNICFTIPRQSSVDPRVCILDLPELNTETEIDRNPNDTNFLVTYSTIVKDDSNKFIPLSNILGNDNIVTKLTDSQLKSTSYESGKFYENITIRNDNNLFVNSLKATFESQGYSIKSSDVTTIGPEDIKRWAYSDEQLDQIAGNGKEGSAKILVKLPVSKRVQKTDKFGVSVSSSKREIEDAAVREALFGVEEDISYDLEILADTVLVSEIRNESGLISNKSLSQYAAFVGQPTPTLNNLDLGNYFRPDNQKYVGKFMHILVNFECINDVISSSIKNLNGEIQLYDFVNNLLQRIQNAMGGINNFKIIYDESKNIFNIVDATPIPGGLNYLNIDQYVSRFQLNTLDNKNGSFVTNFSLKTDITPDLATSITVGAQAQGNQVGYNSVAFSKWNKGLTDRLIIDKSNENNPNIENGAYDPNTNFFDKYIANLNIYYELLFSIANGTVTSDKIDTNGPVAHDLLSYEIGYYAEDGQINGMGFIPLNLNLDFDGLSGIKIYQVYNINEILLPDNYKNNLQFISTSLTHRIDTKGWITTINGIGSPLYIPEPKYKPLTIPTPLQTTATFGNNSNGVKTSNVFYYNGTINWVPLRPDNIIQQGSIKISSAPDSFRRLKSRPHFGIDIAALKDTPIVAPCDGEIDLKSFGGGGLGDAFVMIKENIGSFSGTQSNPGAYHILGHCEKRADGIIHGKIVKKGDVVAYVGDKGSPGAYHLHWEIRNILSSPATEADYNSPILYANNTSAPNDVVTNLSVPNPQDS